MTPADELHAAAALLRQRAEKVPPWARAEPWQVVQTDSEYPDGVLIEGDPDAEFNTAIEAHRESLAAYIATVHPGVGLLLADLLDRAAKRAEVHETFIDAIAVEPHLAVARAILGTDQRHSAQPGTDTAGSAHGTVTG
jgi:hypothetical protein